VSDYNAIAEMIVHGYCENEKDAALKGFNGGVDMEMVS
jgi:beta-glucosidase